MIRKTLWNHLKKVGYNKKLDVLVSCEFTQKDLLNRIFIRESLFNSNKINPFLKWTLSAVGKWVTYHNIKRKWSWLKRGEPAQTLAKPRLKVRKLLLCFWWDLGGIILYIHIHSDL